MKINSVKPVQSGSFGVFKTKTPKRRWLSSDNKSGGTYVSPIETTPKQKSTINNALKELGRIEFPPEDIIYMQNLGINLPFKNGQEAINYLKRKNIDVAYAEFSNPEVHACLDTMGDTPTVFINSNYKDLASHSDVLAISEAIIHEAGHAMDGDSKNSIQEELDCLALNVLAHRSNERAYPDTYKERSSPLYSEGVSLYPELFFEEDNSKKALKQRVSEKYGFLNVSSPGHSASDMAIEIKNCYKNLQ